MHTNLLYYCLTLRSLMDCLLARLHCQQVLRARILKYVAMLLGFFPTQGSDPLSCGSCIASIFFTWIIISKNIETPCCTTETYNVVSQLCFNKCRMKERKTKTGKRHFKRFAFSLSLHIWDVEEWEQWRDLGRHFFLLTFVLDTELVQIPLPGNTAACLLWSMQSANGLRCLPLALPSCGELTSLVSIHCCWLKETGRGL